MDEAINLTLLSDDALADRIRFYDMQMQAAMKLQMKPEAHRNRLHMEAALRERHRRPHLVAAREKELNLDCGGAVA
jgi:hypothetical protein